jgi:succinyl-CoA synthetase beta subunit
LLSAEGIVVPRGTVISAPEQAADVAARIGGPVVVKALVTTGKRGQAGLVRFAGSPGDAESECRRLLGAKLGAEVVDRVLVEERLPVAAELYASILCDSSRKCPLLLFSTEGGMDIEQMHAVSPGKVRMLPLDIRRGLQEAAAWSLLDGAGFSDPVRAALAGVLLKLYAAYRKFDAELLEINPLAITDSGEIVALDCKLVVDDAALPRHPAIPRSSPRGTPLELRARGEGLLYVEMEGDVGVLANGAGLTMATIDAISFYGGHPANFMEIGGQAYKKASSALSIVLGDAKVKSLLVNLCGSFARTDVMVEGIVAGWQKLNPATPVCFSVHGTGQERAVEILRDQLGITPYDQMDDAVRAAILMANGAR